MPTKTILCVASVENDQYIRKQIAKQTLQPNNIFIHIDKNPAQGIEERRIRIADNHKYLVEAVRDLQPDYVWQVEGDSELKPDTLAKLLKDHKKQSELIDDLGYISGIQIGRHGLYCIGAWTDITRTSFKSVDYKLKGLQEVDATGFYCLLAKREVWLAGQSQYSGGPYGPDVEYGLSLKAKGYRLYIDMDINIGHKVKNGIIRPTDMSTCNVRFFKDYDRWKYKQL